jgi:UDP-N-acetylglucosamine--N-acetylmuramyl-(pentapeptide) pyrophosphoryl-undecaprenol N-acetylglucosamine transferase
MVMAGGTGGHVYPALAVARCLREQGAEVTWLGSRDGFEAGVVPDAGFAMDSISVRGLRGKGVLDWAVAPWKLSLALLQSLRVLRLRRPSVVLGMGGFASGPGGLIAWVLNIPLVIHEQNAVPGMTNQWLARLADRVLEAFPGSFAPARGARCTGNPVRADIAEIPPPENRLARRHGPLRLLVLGGSQGAHALNEVVPAALADMPVERRPSVRHQAGRRHVEGTRNAYQQAGVEADVTAFIDDMAAAYAWADVVISRAGALTLAELTAAGVAAILVPYPFAVDDHQTRNAETLVAAGAALLRPQGQLEAASLAADLSMLASDRQRLGEMARSARQLALPAATDTVARVCLEVAR